MLAMAEQKARSTDGAEHGRPVALVTEAGIRQCVRRLAAAIAQEHPAKEPLLVMPVLTGAVVFAAALIRAFPPTLQTEIEPVKARSYSGTRREASVAVQPPVDRLRLAGRHVLLVDCVLDSGHTLAALQDAISARRPASLKTCVLLEKERRRQFPVRVDYVGMRIRDVFVVGYGLDWNGRWRHLPYVAVLPDSEETDRREQ